MIEPLPAYAYPGFVGLAEIESSVREQAEAELKKLAEKLGVSESNQLIEIGSIKGEVLRLAKEKKVELIFSGSHGKHGLGLLLGSTANAILHGAEFDMLIVRSDAK